MDSPASVSWADFNGHDVLVGHEHALLTAQTGRPSCCILSWLNPRYRTDDGDLGFLGAKHLE